MEYPSSKALQIKSPTLYLSSVCSSPSHNRKTISQAQFLLLQVQFSQYFLQMQNNQNHGVSKCDAHCFSLKAIHKERRPNLSAILPMCRNKPNKGKKNVAKCHGLEAPLFNKDACHATPAFILSSEKADYAANAADFLKDHEKKVREYEAEPQELWIPKPRSKNMYCNVCREGYQEYLEHIRSSSHRANIHACPFNGYLLELSRSFRSNSGRQLSLPSSETGTATLGEQQGEATGIRGRKRVKMVNSEANNAVSCPPIDTNQHYTLTGSTQNLFYSQQTLPYQLEIMNRMADCRGLYAQNAAINLGLGMGFNSFYSFLPPGYPMYCMPYQPMMQLEMFQQQH